MLLTRWSQKFYGSTRGRIVALLRRTSSTVDQIAASLGLTDNAVRAHLATLERDGIVEQRVSKRSGVGKPAYTYHLTAEADRLLSRAYIPILGELLNELAERLPPAELDAIMRAVGRRLAAGHTVQSAPLRDRVESAARLLNELGGVTEIEEPDGALRIRGFSCPLSAAVPAHPEVCSAIETLLAEVIGLPVRERCDRASDKARCCFEIARERGG